MTHKIALNLEITLAVHSTADDVDIDKLLAEESWQIIRAAADRIGFRNGEIADGIYVEQGDNEHEVWFTHEHTEPMPTDDGEWIERSPL